jgi:hypothetical protein
MNTIQAMIFLKNGSRKYGFILNQDNAEQIHFIAGTETMWNDSVNAAGMIERIPLEHIASIDTYLK